MKTAISTIFLALLLISFASAAGNSLSQSNSQDVSSGAIYIDQDATNMGIIVGDGNKLDQKNEQNADASGMFSAIFQDAANFGIQVGNGNKLFQANKADADMVSLFWGNSRATLDKVLIEQIQSNLGVQVGDRNDLSQRNDADADVENVAITNGAGVTATATLSKVNIKQNQSNLGVQVGDRNDLSQRNDADADVENVAVAKSKVFASTDASSTPNDADNVRTINLLASSRATSSSRATLSNVNIEQNQANLGVQVGDHNDLSQRNDADADVENVAVAKSKAFAFNGAALTQDADASVEWSGAAWVQTGPNWWNGHWDYASADAGNVGTITQTASSDATSFSRATLNKVNIQQGQTNLGIQVGDRNDLSQRNDADADVENVAVAKSKAFAFNGAALTQDADASTIWTLGGHSTDVGPTVEITQDNPKTETSTASSALNKISIEQCQRNLAVQVGHNFATQSNKAGAGVEQLASNTVEDLHKISIVQKQKNAVVQVGSSAVFQIGGQFDYPTQSDTYIVRPQSNTLVVVNHP